MKSIKSELPLTFVFASRGCIVLLARVGIGGTGGTFSSSAEVTVVLRVRSVAPGEEERDPARDAEAPLICAARSDRSDDAETFLISGVTARSSPGPVDLMKSAKSRVDSVTTLGSRAKYPLRRCAIEFVVGGRATDCRFEARSFTVAFGVDCTGATGSFFPVNASSVSSKAVRGTGTAVVSAGALAASADRLELAV